MHVSIQDQRPLLHISSLTTSFMVNCHPCNHAQQEQTPVYQQDLKGNPLDKPTSKQQHFRVSCVQSHEWTRAKRKTVHIRHHSILKRTIRHRTKTCSLKCGNDLQVGQLAGEPSCFSIGRLMSLLTVIADQQWQTGMAVRLIYITQRLNIKNWSLECYVVCIPRTRVVLKD